MVTHTHTHTHDIAIFQLSCVILIYVFWKYKHWPTIVWDIYATAGMRINASFTAHIPTALSGFPHSATLAYARTTAKHDEMRRV